MIWQLNPIIRGWANYHRHIVATRAFRKAEMVIWRCLWRWAKRRHPEKSVAWIAQRYWHRLGRRRRSFAAPKARTHSGEVVMARLVDLTETPIRRHVKVKAEANPFDPHWRSYFEDRTIFKCSGVYPEDALMW